MSDFDEEAERKRLREKYERDEERRKETQQMSELLLKGATMTNRHCNDCGSPIFRYNGQEFCPSCQRVTGEGGSDEQVGASQGDGEQTTEERQATEDDRTVAGQQPAPDARAVSDEREQAVEADDREQAAGGVKSGVSVTDDGAEPSPTRDTRPSPTLDAESASTDEHGAREALLGALTRHARLAEESDDPRRAKEHLAAAREAAAALDEL